VTAGVVASSWRDVAVVLLLLAAWLACRLGGARLVAAWRVRDVYLGRDPGRLSTWQPLPARGVWVDTASGEVREMHDGEVWGFLRMGYTADEPLPRGMELSWR
jgi:hypothetical protein